MKKKAKALAISAASFLAFTVAPSAVAQPEEEREWMPLKDAGALGKWMRPYHDYCDSDCTVGTKFIDSAPFISNPGKLGKHTIFVSLVGLYVSPKMLNALSGSTNLKNLYVSNTNFDDNSCKAIVTCPNVAVVDVSWDNITNAGLLELAKLPHLHSLKLRGVRITPEMANTLGHMASLDYIDISGTDADSITNLLSAKGFANLRTLGLQNIDFLHFKFDKPFTFPKLHTVAFDQSKVNTDVLNLFAGQPAFKVIRAFEMSKDNTALVKRWGKEHGILVLEEEYIKGR